MPEFEFDVDASITAGWRRFADHLARLLTDLGPEGALEVPIPAPGPASAPARIRFTRHESERIHAEVIWARTSPASARPDAGRLDRLAALGWRRPLHSSDSPGSPDSPRSPDSPESFDSLGPSLSMPGDRALETAHLVAGTLEQVFGIPHPAFLHDGPPSPPPALPDTGAAEAATDVEEADFRPLPISCPDEATRAVGAALAEMYGREMPADDGGVYTVPIGCTLLFVRAHQSLPLIVFRSPLVACVDDLQAAEAEVAILNRDSLWCRYVFDGRTIYAESELVDRVFLPVNFKIQLAELSSEIIDVVDGLAARVSGRRWRDLRST